MALATLISSALTITGAALLLAALLVRCCYAWWARTVALHVHEDGRHRVRWHTTRYEIREEAWPHPAAPPRHAGAEVTVHYHVRRPERWSLTAPYHWGRHLVVVGALLTAAGILTRFLMP